jgi:hypothetical protein
MRVLRKRSRTKRNNRLTPALSLTLRPTTPLGSGTHARYALVVAGDGSINRDAWAKLVGELIQRETKGKKLPFARLIGVDPRTVDRWLHCEVVVKEESVRDVARAFSLQAIDLLVQVGYYKATDLSPPTYPDPHEDPVIKRIMADQRLDENQRAELVQVQLDLIEADVLRRQAEYERLIGYQQGRRDAS